MAVPLRGVGIQQAPLDPALTPAMVSSWAAPRADTQPSAFPSLFLLLRMLVLFKRAGVKGHYSVTQWTVGSRPVRALGCGGGARWAPDMVPGLRRVDGTGARKGV